MGRTKEIWRLRLATTGMHLVPEQRRYLVHQNFEVGEGRHVGRQVTVSYTPEQARRLAEKLLEFAEKSDLLQGKVSVNGR